VRPADADAGAARHAAVAAVGLPVEVHGFALDALFGLDMDRKELALLCQRAENDFVGVGTGIMDQYASLLCEEGAALLVDGVDGPIARWLNSAERLPRKLLLAWHRNPWSEEGPALLNEPVHPGERWLLTVRLRRPHGQRGGIQEIELIGDGHPRMIEAAPGPVQFALRSQLPLWTTSSTLRRPLRNEGESKSAAPA
jgi:hypothetical protein